MAQLRLILTDEDELILKYNQSLGFSYFVVLVFP